MRALAAWLLFLLVPLPVLADSLPPPIVAVFQLESRNSPLKDHELLGLTDYLATKLGEGGDFQIIPRDEIRKRLTDSKARSYEDCVDQSCQVAIGRELAAQFTVTSHVSRVGSRCLLTAQLFDLRKAATAMTASAKKPCDADDLVDGVEEVARQFQDKMRALRAVAAGKPAPDPKPAPTTPPTDPQPEPLAEPAPLGGPDPIPASDQDQAPPAESGGTPVYKAWWFWTLIGVGVVGLAVGIAYATGAFGGGGGLTTDGGMLRQAPDLPPGTLGGGAVFRF